MLIKNSIIAGEILLFLEESEGFVSLEELTHFLEESFCNIQEGVERLVREGLVVLDADRQKVKVSCILDFGEIKDSERKTKVNKFAFL